MAVPLYTVNAGATLLEKDRRLIARVLREVPPDSKAGGKQTWRLPTIVDALIADASGRDVDAEPGLTSARTRVALAKAETAERQNQMDAGEWCRIEQVVAMYAAEIITIREHFLSLPGKLVGSLAAADQYSIYQILKTEIWESLDRMADGRGASAVVVDAINASGGKASGNPDVSRLLEAIEIICGQMDELREARRKKIKGGVDA
jgi:hypothetical protein